MRSRRAAGRGIGPGAAVLVLALAAVAMRGWHAGDPLLGVDQQFYLVVGQRMWQGMLPYRDIFDIKPLGIFLFHAGTARLGPDPRLAADLAATAFAAATAFVVHLIVRDVLRTAAGVASRTPAGCAATRTVLGAPDGAGILAGFLYLAYLPVYDGYGAQTPVIYNFFTALAGSIVVRLAGRDPASPRWALAGGAAMASLGVGLMFKYTVVFEGVWMGLYLMWAGHRRGMAPARTILRATWWAGCALVPFAVALGSYAAMGAAGPFLQANLFTVLKTGKALSPWMRPVVSLGLLLPLLAAAGRAWAIDRKRTIAGPDGDDRDALRRQVRFVTGWLLAALFGYLAYGTWLRHYALPLLVPACAAAGLAMPSLAASPRGRIAAVLFAVLVLAVGTYRVTVQRRDYGTPAQLAALTADIVPALGHRCLYLFDAPPALYTTTGACMTTRFAFPQHLENSRFAAYPPVSQSTEIARIMATRPGAVVLGTRPLSQTVPQSRETLEAALWRHYRLSAIERVGDARYAVWLLRR